MPILTKSQRAGKILLCSLSLFINTFSFSQTCFITSPPIDKGPGAILIVNNNLIQSVNLVTGSIVTITAAPFLVINNMAVDPVRNKIYYADNSVGTRTIKYYDMVTKTHNTLTNGLTGVSPGPGSPDISTAGACMTSDGALFIANHNNNPTRIYKLILSPSGSNVISSADYIRFTSNKLFGDFVIANNQLICHFVDGTFQIWNIPAASPTTATIPNYNFLPNIYCQMATGWDGSVYRIGTSTGVIDKYTNVITGSAVYTGITLPPPGGIGMAYKDAAGPVPSSARINGDISCLAGEKATGITINIFYDVDQDGKLDPSIDKPVATAISDMHGQYSFPDLIPDYYLVQIPAQPGVSAEIITSTKNNYGGKFLNIGENWINNISSNDVVTTACNGSALPLSIKLGSKQIMDGLQLFWTSGLHLPGGFFEIEKSDAGADWKRIKQLSDINGQTAYSTKVDLPEAEINYYRVRQNSVNRTYTYSNIIKYNGNEVHQNPIIYFDNDRRVIHIQLNGITKTKGTANLFNVTGQTISSLDMPPNSKVYELNVSGVRTGIYYLSFINGDIRYTKTICVYN